MLTGGLEIFLSPMMGLRCHNLAAAAAELKKLNPNSNRFHGTPALEWR
jgi:hypothetical protein